MDQLPDASLIELAQGGDQHAFAELYTRYFDPVYDFVARMTRNREEAADIAQDTFLKAMNALGGLQKGASFKSWIFTIARNTALNRIEKNARTRPLTFEGEDGEEVGFDVVDSDRFSDPQEAAEANAVASLVWQAAAGLDPKQLSLLDLHLRQGLDSGEIADVLGVTKNNGYVMLNRLKKAVEDAIGAFIMFKDGRQYCGDLDAVLSKADIDGMSPEVRKLVDRHVAQCPNCEERKRKLAPLAAFAAFGAIGAPAGAKAHILEGLLQQWPGPAASAGPTGSGGGGAGGGTPAAGGAGGGGGLFGGANAFIKAGAGLGMAAALLLLALFLPASPIALTRGGGEETAQAEDGSPGGDASPLPTAPGGGAATNTPTPQGNPTTTPAGTGTAQPGQATNTPGPSATPTRTNTPVPTPGPGTPTFTPSPTRTNTATPTRTNTPTPTTVPPTSTPTPPPCTPTIFVNTSTVNVAPGGNSSFLVFNSSNCSASFTISDDGAPWLSYGPSSGSVGPSGTSTVSLSVSASLLPAAEGTYTATVTVTGPTNSVSILVSSTRTNPAPQVLSASGVCNTAAAPTTTFSVSATDDDSVASVVVYWNDSGGNPRQFALTKGSGNGWGGTTSLTTRNGSNFRAVATDNAGKTGQLAFVKPC